MAAQEVSPNGEVNCDRVYVLQTKMLHTLTPTPFPTLSDMVVKITIQNPKNDPSKSNSDEKLMPRQEVWEYEYV